LPSVVVGFYSLEKGINNLFFDPLPVTESVTLIKKSMYNFKVTVAITDESNNEVTTFSLPTIESGDALAKVLATAETLIKPFLPVIGVTAAVAGAK
jgi:hypothetical protein